MGEIGKLYSEHTKTMFPNNLKGIEVLNIDLVLLDANIAGCVSSYLQNGGHLDSQRVEILKRLCVDVNSVLKEIPSGEREYFVKLKRLGDLVIRDVKI